MEKTVSIKDVTNFIISYGELMDQKVNDAMIKELQSLPSESKEGWISVEEAKAIAIKVNDECSNASHVSYRVDIDKYFTSH